MLPCFRKSLTLYLPSEEMVREHRMTADEDLIGGGS